MNNVKYPKEIVALVRNQTFSITNELTTPNLNEGESPLSFYNERFARFPMTIINKDRKFSTANLKVGAIAGIKQKSEYAINKDLSEDYSDNKDLSLAYTVALTSGKLKGKTPAEVLLEDPKNTTLLNSQYAWLKENLKKYPNNQKQMDAIEDAAKLLKDGKLNKDNLKQASLTIYESGIKTNIHRKREDGKSFVNEMNIRYTLGANYPVEINIINFWANYTKNEKGLINITGERADIVNNTFYMTADEWLHCLYMMQVNMNTFEMLHAQALYKASAEKDKENRESKIKVKSA